jgi:DHA1 family inner membrane transport protein
VVVALGLGYRAPIWLGVGLTIAGIVITVIAYWLERRTGRLRAHTRPMDLTMAASGSR